MSLAGLFWCLGWSPEAVAHRPGLSYAKLHPDHLELVFAEPELARRVPLADLDAASLALRDLIVGRTVVSVGGAPCTVGEVTLARVEADGLSLTAPLGCPEGGEWTLAAGWLGDFPVGHRHYVEAFGQSVAVLDRAAPEVSFAAGEPARGAVARRFVGLGVEHIVWGTDHLVFLFGLLLVATSAGQIAAVVTGFTVAHSLTLVGAAHGAFSLSPAVVEPLIGLTIAWVGVENLLILRPGRSPGEVGSGPPASGSPSTAPTGSVTRRRLATTFALGLVHGFGFAGVLAELGLPTASLAVALVSFNVGVELGQLALVLLAMPFLLALRRYPGWVDRWVPGLSVGIVGLGLWWFGSRLVG